MIPKPKHDIYIKAGERHAKIAWVHEYKDFEVMIGFYGFKGNDPVKAYEYPNRTVSTEEMNNGLTIVHAADILPTEIPKSHFTFHRDQSHRPGEFHLKYGEDSKHIVRPKGKISEDVPVFLDFILISDVISRYEESNTKPDETDLVFEIDTHQSISLRVQYCGKNFNFQSTKLICICDRKLKAYFQPQVIYFNEEALKNKIPGTFFIIRFQTENDFFHLKTFVFS